MINLGVPKIENSKDQHSAGVGYTKLVTIKTSQPSSAFLSEGQHLPIPPLMGCFPHPLEVMDQPNETATRPNPILYMVKKCSVPYGHSGS